MANENEIKLPSLDDLFSSQKERNDAKLKRIEEICICKCKRMMYNIHIYTMMRRPTMSDIIPFGLEKEALMYVEYFPDLSIPDYDDNPKMKFLQSVVNGTVCNRILS